MSTLPIFDLIGAPQIAAALLLAQRGLEEIYSARNTKRLLAQGAHEIGAGFYPVVAATASCLDRVAGVPDFARGARDLAADRLLPGASNGALLGDREPRALLDALGHHVTRRTRGQARSLPSYQPPGLTR